MNNRNLTSANCILILTVPPLFAVGRRIQGFAMDDIFDADPVDNAETSMGVDGRLSAGYIPAPVSMNIALQADSQSNDFFEDWINYERSAREKLIASGTVLIPSIERKYAMSRGFLRTVQIIPAAKKTLQPRRYKIEWERLSPAPQF